MSDLRLTSCTSQAKESKSKVLEGSQSNRSLELQEKLLELAKAPDINAASLSPNDTSRRIDGVVKEIMGGVRARLQSIKENMDVDHALKMNEMDNLLLEKDNLLKEKDDVLEKEDRTIRTLVMYVSRIYEESDTAKKRSFGDIATTSQERRTRSRVFYQDTEYEEENATSAAAAAAAEVGEENTTKHQEEKEEDAGEGGENATTSA